MPNIPRDIVAGPFYYAEQNGCLKILTGCGLKLNVLESTFREGLLALQYLFFSP